MDQQTVPKPQPLTKAKWERYRDEYLKTHNHNGAAIALQLWNCCPKDLYTVLRSNVMDNTSTKAEVLTKMKTVNVTMQNFIVEANTFLCMRHKKAESVWLLKVSFERGKFDQFDESRH